MTFEKLEDNIEKAITYLGALMMVGLLILVIGLSIYLAYLLSDTII